MSNKNKTFISKPLTTDNEFSTSDVKVNIKLRSFFLMFFAVPLWALAIIISEDSFLWGGVVFIIAAFATYVLVKKFTNDFKLKKSDLYFKVSGTGIEYTSPDEISGGIIRHSLLWSEVVTRPRDGNSSDVYFLNNGYKNNTKNIVIYISRQPDKVEEIHIPIHNIKIFRHHWEISRSILINMALLQHITLTIDEELFYYFNLNPTTFTFSKKNIRRFFSDVLLTGIMLAVLISCVAGGFSLSDYLNIDLKDLVIPSMIGSVIISFLTVMVLVQHVSFFRNSHPEFTQIAYKDNRDIALTRQSDNRLK